MLRLPPATIIRPAHIAPGVASETAMDVDTVATGNAVDGRKALARPCPQADRGGNDARRRQRGGRHQQHSGCDKQSSQFHDEFLLLNWNAVAKQTFPRGAQMKKPPSRPTRQPGV